MPLDPGRKDHYVLVQHKIGGTDEAGFPIEQWADLVWVFAFRRSLTGAEVFKAARETPTASVLFQIGYREDLDPDLHDLPTTRRIVYQGRPYDVVYAEPEGRHHDVRLFCQATPAPSSAAARRVH